MSPQMLPKPPTLQDQTTNQMQRLSLTVRVPSHLMAQTVKCHYPRKRSVRSANTPRLFLLLQPSSVSTLIVRLPPTESLLTKKIITVTRKKKAKRTTWSPQLLVHVILGLKQILEGTIVHQELHVLDLRRPAPPKPAV